MTQVPRLSLLDRATHAEYVAFFVVLSEMLPYCALHPVKLPPLLCVVCPAWPSSLGVDQLEKGGQRQEYSEPNPSPGAGWSCLQVVWEASEAPCAERGQSILPWGKAFPGRAEGAKPWSTSGMNFSSPGVPPCGRRLGLVRGCAGEGSGCAGIFQRMMSVGVRLSPARLPTIPVATGLPGWARQSSKLCISPSSPLTSQGVLLQDAQHRVSAPRPCEHPSITVSAQGVSDGEPVRGWVTLNSQLCGCDTESWPLCPHLRAGAQPGLPSHPARRQDTLCSCLLMFVAAAAAAGLEEEASTGSR